MSIKKRNPFPAVNEDIKQNMINKNINEFVIVTG